MNENIMHGSRIKPKVIIYVDGACSGNPGPGGFGALLKFKDINKEIVGYELDTTNNRMELTAGVEALKCLKTSCNVEIYTDSKYLQLGVTKWIDNWIKNNWRKSDNVIIKNLDLWQKLYEQLSKHDIIWKWVKGHSDNIGNIKADQLAVQGRDIAIANKGK